MGIYKIQTRSHSTPNVIKLRKDRDRDRLQYLSLFLFKIFLHTTKRQIALCLKNVYSIYDARLFCRGILC